MDSIFDKNETAELARSLKQCPLQWIRKRHHQPVVHLIWFVFNVIRKNTMEMCPAIGKKNAVTQYRLSHNFFKLKISWESRWMSRLMVPNSDGLINQIFDCRCVMIFRVNFRSIFHSNVYAVQSRCKVLRVCNIWSIEWTSIYFSHKTMAPSSGASSPFLPLNEVKVPQKRWSFVS